MNLDNLLDMAKNLSYKIIKDIKDGYRTKFLDIPQVEHNIGESLIVNVADLHYKTITNDSYIRRTYAYVTEEVFENVISGKLIFPSVIINYGGQYLGAIIVRCERGDILTYVTHTTNNKIYLIPSISFEIDERYPYYNTTNILPKRNVKIFLSMSEYKTDVDKKNKKWKENRKAYNENYERVEKVAPIFSFKTPKFKVIEVAKKTAYLPNIKEGDIIYGEIPVIKETDNRKFGALHGIGTLTNWVTLYINDVKVNTISPKTFPSLFFNNIIVEEIK